MPVRAPTPCRKPGCGALCRDGTGYCEAHKHDGWQRHQQGKTSAQRGYGIRWQRLRDVIVRRDKGMCVMCLARGIAKTGTDVDHIIAKARGGTDDPANLQLLCREHHRAKTAKESQGGGGSNLYGFSL